MQTATSGTDYSSAPKNYAELFETYYVYVVRLVHRMGIDDNSKEDVASEILTRFYERDFLAKFDPTLVFEYKGQERPARFKSFLSRFVLTYVRGHYDKQQRIKHRESLICDMPLSGDSRTGATETVWAELYGGEIPGPEDSVLDALEEEAVVQGLRVYLSTVPRRSRFDSCDLVMLFDEVMQQIHTHGELNLPELTKIFRVSSTAMHGWIWWLRENIAHALGRPVPAKRPRVTRPKAVEQ